VADKKNYLVGTPKPVGRYTAREINDVNPEAKYGFHTQHRLVDYDQWFSIFKDSTFRKKIEEANGLRCVRVLRETENQNNAVIIFQGPSQDAYDAMHNDPRSKSVLMTSLFLSNHQDVLVASHLLICRHYLD